MLSLVDLLQTNHPSSSSCCTIEIDLNFVTVVPNGVEVACCYLKSDFFFKFLKNKFCFFVVGKKM